MLSSEWDLRKYDLIEFRRLTPASLLNPISGWMDSADLQWIDDRISIRWYGYIKLLKERRKKVLSDKFFEEYAKTAAPREDPDVGEPDEKESYTAAEVDNLVNNKVQEAIEEMQNKLMRAAAERQSEPEIPAESEE